MKKVLSWFGRILLTGVSVPVFLFSIATLIPAVPVLGSVANIVTVGYLHLWIPVCAALFVLSLLLVLAGRRKKIWTLDLLLSAVSLILMTVVACMIAASVRQAGVKPNLFLQKEDVSFVRTDTETYTRSEYGDVKINVYYTEDNRVEKPVMLYIHGGGWIQGSREDHTYYSKVFAAHGYVVFSADYDLSSEDRHLAGSTETQLIEAFAWVKNHAADYRGDVTRLYLTGGSAGGNLALEMAYKINGGMYSTSQDGTELPQIRAVSVTFPVASLETFYNNPDPVLGGTAHRMAYGYTGCAPEEDPALFASLDPVNSISENAPPTHILVGASDSLVPPQATYEMDEALEAAGIKHRTVIAPFANHIFDMVDGNMLNCAYLELSLRWFEQFR